ncbi:NADH:flavin oxidoreductase [Brooklawnia cerclae]|uniref:2,4-dienoyl-CoA reductase-like NADH-dependent reductase (Old Yellow Enzyme family) n=1 Tax=Brooklawnia cerclae TaxID=349934 RepID=A0ABX0SEI0_9ACTN|nr:12-oxophytodienoate reductase [Brooklawnia cerclae]NIH56803.1 2,4-dienoyl-CoA reductase-like NADH-dependent reductase (Old Yellow Enzyme family) [Brooklawnia cerclae]
MDDHQATPAATGPGPATIAAVDSGALFRPFGLEGLELSNRLVMAPMTRWFSPGGVPGDEVARYYARRAPHMGLLITEGAFISHPSSGSNQDIPHAYGSAALDGWGRVVEAVHEAGGRIAMQLWHVGLARRQDGPLHPGVPALSPSGVDGLGHTVGRAATRDDLRAITESYAQAAADAQRIGFDGVEVHGAHGFLLDSFVWTRTNRREDEYGGVLTNRVRFPVEVVSAIRDAVGPGFPILYRFSQWKNGAYDARIADDPDELARILRPLADAGVSAFHASTRRFWAPAFDGSPLTLAGWAAKVSGRPAIAVGSAGIDSPGSSGNGSAPSPTSGDGTAHVAEAARRVAAGEFDLLAVGRAVLSDPAWAVKVRAGDPGSILRYRKEDEDTLDGLPRRLGTALGL